jgi:2-polyprenyl-6-methoxyphenol hydroxylase-like FAD-dependent oxidoreductase
LLVSLFPLARRLVDPDADVFAWRQVMRDRLLVVGGGIAGFGLLRALSLRGVSCTLVERLPAPPGSGLGLNLPGNAVRALAALGLADEVIDRGIRIRRREYRNKTGRLLFAVDEETFWGAVGPSVCLRRGDLLDILRASTPEVTPRWDTPLVRAELLDEAVRVQLESGPTETYDFVVGADGVHSSVRRALLPADTLRRSLMTEASWRFTAPNPGADCWTVWSGAQGSFLLIPVDGERVYGYASTTRGGAAGDDPQWLARTFAGFPEPVCVTVAGLLDDPGQLYYSPVEEVRCERWSRGRLALIGDAAHATGPVWAQGAAMALEDALVLADLLAEGSDWSRVGAEFERLRRPRVGHVQAATDKMSRIAGLPGRLRDLVAPVLGPKAYRAAYGPLRTPVAQAVTGG